MENEKVKRGIDFSNRVGEGQSASYRKSLSWWRGGKLNKRTSIFLVLVFTLNFIGILPLFQRNISGAFESSSAFMLVADLLEQFLFIPNNIFFTTITIISLSFAPVAFYLFIRKIALRHDLTALIATLIYIFPNPFFGYSPSLGAAVIYGDGAHAVVFSFLPLFLLYVESFIASGIPILGVLTVIGTAVIAILSPFMMFNLLFIYPVLAIAEGFLGDLRVKLLRMVFIFTAAFALSIFWYFPTFFSHGIQLSHVVYTIDKSFHLFPLLIPIVPLFGALFFLVFDRRRRLKPIFIGASLLLIYIMFFSASRDIMIGGVFTPERYRLELNFATSITLSLIVIITLETLKVEIINFRKRKLFFAFLSVLIFASIITFILMSLFSVYSSYLFMKLEPIRRSSGIGIGNLVRIFRFDDIPSLIMDFISLGTFIFLLYILKTYPSLRKKIPKSTSS